MIQPVDIGGGANNGGFSFKFDLEVPKTQPIQLYLSDTSSTFIFNNPFSLQQQQQQQILLVEVKAAAILIVYFRV